MSQVPGSLQALPRQHPPQGPVYQKSLSWVSLKWYKCDVLAARLPVERLQDLVEGFELEGRTHFCVKDSSSDKQAREQKGDAAKSGERSRPKAALNFCFECSFAGANRKGDESSSKARSRTGTSSMKLGCAFKFYVQIYSAEASSAFILLYNEGVHSTRPDAAAIHGQGCQGDEKLQMAPKLSHACKRWAMEKLQQGVSKDVILLDNRERLLKQYGGSEVGERRVKAVLASPGARDFLLNRKDLNNFEKKLKEGKPELGVDSIEAARQLTRAARALVAPSDAAPPRASRSDGAAHGPTDAQAPSAPADHAIRPRACGSDSGDALAEVRRAAFGRLEYDDGAARHRQRSSGGADGTAALWQRPPSHQTPTLSHLSGRTTALSALDAGLGDVGLDARDRTVDAALHRRRSLHSEARELAALMSVSSAAAAHAPSYSLHGGGLQALPTSAPAATQALSDGAAPHSLDLWGTSAAAPNELSGWTSQLYASLFPVLSAGDAWHALPTWNDPALLRLSQTSLPSLLTPRSDGPSLNIPEERHQPPPAPAPVAAPPPAPAPPAGGSPPQRVRAPSSSNMSEALTDAASALDHWQRLRQVLRRSFDDWLDRMHDHVASEAAGGRVADLDCAHAAYADVKAWHHMAPWAPQKRRARKFRAPPDARGAPHRSQHPSASPSDNGTADGTSSGDSSMCSSSDDDGEPAASPQPQQQPQQQQQQKHAAAAAVVDCEMRAPPGEGAAGDAFRDITESEEAMAAVATMCALAEDARRGVQALPQRGGPLAGLSDEVATQILCATAERVRHATFAANPTLVDLHHKHLRLQKELFNPGGFVGGASPRQPAGLSPRMVQAAISLHANNLCEIAQTIAAAPM